MDINKYKMGNAKRTLENMARLISIALVVLAKYLQRNWCKYSISHLVLFTINDT